MLDLNDVENPIKAVHTIDTLARWRNPVRLTHVHATVEMKRGHKPFARFERRLKVLVNCVDG